MLAPERFGICAAGTKSGKTMGCVIWAVLKAWGKRKRVGWFAPSYSQAKIGYNLLKEMVPAHLRRANDAELVVYLPVGSEFHFKTAEKPALIYGAAYDLFVIDEASRIREAAWHAIRSTITQTKAPGKIIANAKGKANWFFRSWRLANEGRPGWSCHRISTVANPYVDPLEVAEARRDLPERKFLELYEAEFFADAQSIFGDISCRIDKDIMGMPKRGRAYVIGADLGKHGDPSVCIVCDIESGQMVSMAIFPLGLPWDQARKRIARIATTYNDAFILVDSTGVGDPVLDEMKDMSVRVEGYKFTNETKDNLISALMKDVETGQISWGDWPTLSEEMQDFQATRLPGGAWRYAAPEGAHDDTVIALGLANWARRDRKTKGSLLYV
ncbi:hypothetical protein LCGC14_0427700 [marine sediment metagenome]|uniref:Uncharacterized protein n=1 Tax=marine sediment metagenome TaxID=412755 RepID=A0A0F9SP47_9ZZZZ